MEGNILVNNWEVRLLLGSDCKNEQEPAMINQLQF